MTERAIIKFLGSALLGESRILTFFHYVKIKLFDSRDPFFGAISPPDVLPEQSESLSALIYSTISNIDDRHKKCPL